MIKLLSKLEINDTLIIAFKVVIKPIVNVILKN